MKRNAELKLRIDALDAEIQRIHSHIDATNSKTTALQEQLDRTQNNINVDLFNIRTRIHALDVRR